jgi:hypothetical protein
MNFALKQYHGWTLTELENMIPFERELYVILLKEHLEEERKRQEELRVKQHG